MKTVTLVALTGAALTADHSYFRSNPIKTPVKADSPSIYKLEHSFLPRRFEDEEFNYSKDFQQVSENAEKYAKKTEHKDDLDEEELDLLRTLMGLMNKSMKLSQKEISDDVDYDDYELHLGKVFKNDKMTYSKDKSKGRDFIRFDDEELALIRPVFQQKHEVKFDDPQAPLPDFVQKWLQSTQNHDLKGRIKFDDDELHVISNDVGSKIGGFSSHNLKPRKFDDDDELFSTTPATTGKEKTRIAAFTRQRRPVSDNLNLDDEADNSLLSLGGLIKEGYKRTMM